MPDPTAPDVPDCTWPRCKRKPNPCFAWCKCACHVLTPEVRARGRARLAARAAAQPALAARPAPDAVPADRVRALLGGELDHGLFCAYFAGDPCDCWCSRLRALLADHQPADHPYTSTACHHARHDDCRRVCKWCDAGCRCGCHQPAERETTEGDASDG